MAKKRSLIAMFIVLAILGVYGLQSVFAVSNEELIIYSGRSDKFVNPVVEAFTKKTGIKVKLHSAQSTALLNKLSLEGKRTQADLYLSNDAGNLQVGADRKLFAPIDEKIVNVIPPNLRADDNTWVGLSARARVLVVNAKSPYVNSVKSIFDLADPAMFDKVAVTNSANESFIAGVTVYMQSQEKAKVKDWLAGVKKNMNGEAFSKHSHIVKAVASGKKQIGLVNHYYIYRHLAKEPNAPVKILLPDQDNGMGVAWNVAGVAITKHTKKKDAALKFIEFVVSEEGQALFAGTNREYPTRKNVSAAAEVPPAESFKVAKVPMSDLAKFRNSTIDLLEEIGMP